MPDPNGPRLSPFEFTRRAVGLFGVLIAVPLMVALPVIVQMLYVEDVLGDSPRILGE